MTASTPLNGVFQPLEGPPLRNGVPVTGGFAEFLPVHTWSDWFNKIPRLLRQIRVWGTLDFPNTNAQTRSGPLSVAFSLTVDGRPILVPSDSFVTMHIRSALPSGGLFTADMGADNQVDVYFHNYTSAAINPGPIDFEFLIEKKKP